jgi:pimeloyl-ACP methyl ester carboxylesterase
MRTKGEAVSSAANAGMALDARGRPVPRLPERSPAWMAQAFAEAPRLWNHVVESARIEVQEWGPLDAPALLLLHGQAANADWWRFIAPQLAGNRRVIVPSLSGMGGSDWRESYGTDIYAREIVALIAAAGITDVAIAAHSYGCLVSLAAARIIGEAIASLALIDFYIQPPSIEPRLPPHRSVRRYSTLDQALARFRLSPPQDCPNPSLLDYIANRTACFVDGDDSHWSWVSDPGTLVRTDHDVARCNLAAVTCPLLILRGARSRLVDAPVAAHVREMAPPHARFVEIPDADHHVLVDQPLATVAALRTWLSCQIDEQDLSGVAPHAPGARPRTRARSALDGLGI